MAREPTRHAPVAILLHELADGSAHVDLLIARSDGPFADDDRVVPTWRVAVRPDAAPDAAVLGLESIDDHRALYLRLTLPRRLDRDRGLVTPLRRGRADREGSRLRIRWDDGGCSVWSLAETGDGLIVESNLTAPAADAECGASAGAQASDPDSQGESRS